MSDVSDCQACGSVIAEVVTRSTIPGVDEFIDGVGFVCSKCFDAERMES
tara:strand:+ start:274 stop:420 length:147 start_codon:yes stop_codon:yes gene_type:complete